MALGPCCGFIAYGHGPFKGVSYGPLPKAPANVPYIYVLLAVCVEKYIVFGCLFHYLLDQSFGFSCYETIVYVCLFTVSSWIWPRDFPGWAGNKSNLRTSAPSGASQSLLGPLQAHP